MGRYLWKGVVVAVLLFVALYPRSLFLKLVEWESRVILAKRFHTSFAFDALEWKEGALHIEKGSLAGGLEGSFESVRWKPAFSLFRREVGGQLEIVGLKLTKKESSLPSSSRKRWSCLHFNFELAIKDAALRFDDVDLVLDIIRQDQQLTISSDLSGHNLSDLYKTVCGLWQVPEPLADWDVVGGELKGELRVSFAKGHLYHLEGRLDATKIEAENLFLSLYGEWEKMHVDFDLDMSSALKVDTWDGTFSLIGGRLSLLPDELDFWDGMWDFSQLHSMVAVKNGKVESSFLRGTFLGMHGEIDLDWHSRETLMELAFAGNSTEMLPLMPEKLRAGFASGFPDDRFALDATIKRAREGLKLEGTLEVGDAHRLDFGCHFGAGARTEQLLPPIGTFADKLKEQFCLSSKRLGWFHGQGFPLEKFFSPFFIPDETLSLSGSVNFEGTFDERYLVLFYEGEHFHLEGNSFDLKVERVNEEVAHNQVAVHYIDLKTGDHEGLLPLHFAQYTQKRQQVVFEPIAAVAHIENNQVHIKDIETEWAALHLKGEAKIKLDGFADVDLALSIPEASGPLEDALELMEYFYALPNSEPIVGSFATIDQGLFLSYKSGRLDQLTFSAACEANTLFRNVHLEEASFDFHYDRKKRTLLFAEGQLHAVYENKEYPLCFEELVFAPDDWRLKTEQLEATIQKGEICIRGLIEGVGRKEGQRYTLDHFALGNWQGVLDFEGKILHQFLLQGGGNELRLHGSHGCFDIEQVTFDLSTLFPHKLHPWHPEGMLRGSGTLYYAEEWQAEVSAAFENLAFGGLRFGSGENVCCSFSQSEGVSIEGLEAQAGEARYKLGSFHYIPREEKLHFDGFDFAVPASRLEEIVTIASELFPGKIHSSICDHLIALKENEELAGRVNLEVFPNTVWITLTLNDGRYKLFDQDFDLRSFSLCYDPLELNIKTQARYGEGYYWLRFDAETPTLNEGSLAIYEEEGGEQLFVRWDPVWRVAEVGGSLAGCSADLKATPEKESIDFEGSLTFDSQRIVPLLSGKMRRMLERIAIKGGYTLDGQWSFSRTDPFNPDFYGRIEGHNCGACAVSCNSFSSDLEYRDEELLMHNLRVIDWSGTMAARDLSLVKRGKSWALACDQLCLENFRLSRLSSPWTDMQKRERPLFRSFCIPQLTLNNFSGTLGDPKSFEGSGTLHFTNYAKKTLFSNLMQLPVEISARLGLDLTTMIPVRGQVLYTIADERIYINEFRDVYSEGKRARFYLAGEEPAYIDFAGNLDVKIRMKQYTLLMKIAELFTLSVKGTIFNPLYTITNQD